MLITLSNPTDRVLRGGGSVLVNLDGSVSITPKAGFGLGIGVAPSNNAIVRLQPQVTGSTSYYGMRVDPTWTNPGAGGVNYGYSDFTTVALTAHNTATGISSYYGQVITDTSAFNVSGTLTAFKGIVTFNGTGNVTGTLTCFIGTAGTAPTSTGTINEIGGGHINAQHQGTGLVTLMYGMVARADLSGSGGAVDGNASVVKSFYSELYMSGLAATPGVVTLGVEFGAQGPAFVSSSVTGVITSFYNFFANASFNTYNGVSTSGGFTAAGLGLTTGKQGGNTSGTNNNYGIVIGGNGGSGGSGGAVNNYGIFITLAAPGVVAGNTNHQYGIRITGNGATLGGNTTNWAIYSDSTANTYLAGSLGLGMNASIIATSLCLGAAWDICPSAGSTTMVGGFLYIPSGAGAPTGAPTNLVAGRTALYYDETNFFLYARAFGAAWKKSTVYA